MKVDMNSSKWMVTGAWQEMFKLTGLEERVCNDKRSQRVLYSDGVKDVVCTEVDCHAVVFTIDSHFLRRGDNLAL